VNSLYDVSEIILQDVFVEEIEILPVMEVVETELKHVECYGTQLILPFRFNYIAADENGLLTAFVNKPKLENNIWKDTSFNMKLKNANKPIEDWKQSLMEI